MKTIGFRIWDKETKKMIFSGKTPKMLTTFFKHTAVLNARDKIDYQQFTGLFDRNGDGIYEGDVLRFSPESKYDETNYMAYEVFFHSGDAVVGRNIGYDMCRTHCFGSISGGFIPRFIPFTTKKMIIIGNTDTLKLRK